MVWSKSTATPHRYFGSKADTKILLAYHDHHYDPMFPDNDQVAASEVAPGVYPGWTPYQAHNDDLMRGDGPSRPKPQVDAERSAGSPLACRQRGKEAR